MNDVATCETSTAQDTVVAREVTVFPKYLNTEEVAGILNVSVQAVQRWCNIGTLPASRFGSLWRVKVSDLQEFILEGERKGREHTKGHLANMAARKQQGTVTQNIPG